MEHNQDVAANLENLHTEGQPLPKVDESDQPTTEQTMETAAPPEEPSNCLKEACMEVEACEDVKVHCKDLGEAHQVEKETSKEVASTRESDGSSKQVVEIVKDEPVCGRWWDGKTWSSFDKSTSTETVAASSDEVKLKVVQYNVWFDAHRSVERNKHVFALIQENSPDVVCFQEVTPPFLQRMKEDGFIRKNYVFSDTQSAGYSAMLLIKHQHQPVFYEKKFENSRMSRSLIRAEIELKIDADRTMNCCVATSHFESGRSRDVRREQFKISFSGILSRFTNVILCGDFNMDPSWLTEQICIPADYIDAWLALHAHEPEESGHTMPPLPSKKSRRIDRVLVKSQELTVSRCDLIGTAPLKKATTEECAVAHPYRPCTPSDHYGLLAHFSLDTAMAAAQLEASRQRFEKLLPLATEQAQKEAAEEASRPPPRKFEVKGIEGPPVVRKPPAKSSCCVQ
eukprot:Colp12_sorted_trinity150504_noHs@24159